jgi:MYXO-CTERM domain-containing protein
VWVLDVATHRPLGLWQVTLDRQTGKVLASRSTLIRVSGNVYDPNPTVGTQKQVELVGLTETDKLVGEFADVSSCMVNSSDVACQRYAVPDAAGDYLFSPKEPSNSDPFSEVQAYYHVDRIHRWMQDTFGFVRGGATQSIDVLVNLYQEGGWWGSYGYPNAFFGDLDGDGTWEIVFGQSTRDFAYDADVIYHEFTHSAVNETSDLNIDIDDLGFNMMPMGLNEGFADLFSSALAGDPKVGEYAGNGGIRDLTGSASCPDNLSGESHSDGLIWGRANWAIRSQAADTQVFDEVLYKTMAGLSSAATMADAAALFLKVAGTTDPTLAQDAQAEYTARGLIECSRIVPLKDGSTRQGYILGTDIGLQVVPGPMQYRIEVPDTAEELEISISKKGWGGSSLGLYVREGTPVKFSSYKGTYDFVMPNNETSITLTKGDFEFPLLPGGEYYVLPVNVGQYEVDYYLSMELTNAPSEPDAGPANLDMGPDLVPVDGPAPDGVADDPGEGDGGCSCRVGQGSASPSSEGLLWLLPLALPLLFRRRRRGQRGPGSPRAASTSP